MSSAVWTKVTNEIIRVKHCNKQQLNCIMSSAVWTTLVGGNICQLAQARPPFQLKDCMHFKNEAIIIVFSALWQKFILVSYFISTYICALMLFSSFTYTLLANPHRSYCGVTNTANDQATLLCFWNHSLNISVYFCSSADQFSDTIL